MHAAALVVELRLPSSHSLKEKRAVIRPIIEGARKRYQVAVAETEHNDKWQRAQIAVAAVASSEKHLCEILDEVERFVWSFPEVEVLQTDRRFLEEG